MSAPTDAPAAAPASAPESPAGKPTRNKVSFAGKLEPLGFKGLLLVMGFAGLMMASAGAAIVPASVKMTALVLCPRGETVDSVVITRSTRTSKGGTSMSWHLVCIDGEGGGKAIGPFDTFLALWVEWTVIFLAWVYARRGLRRLQARARARVRQA